LATGLSPRPLKPARRAEYKPDPIPCNFALALL
jgi:hypothetical protein